MMMMRNYEMIMLYILHDDIGEDHLYDGESLGLLYLILNRNLVNMMLISHDDNFDN